MSMHLEINALPEQMRELTFDMKAQVGTVGARPKWRRTCSSCVWSAVADDGRAERRMQDAECNALRCADISLCARNGILRLNLRMRMSGLCLGGGIN